METESLQFWGVTYSEPATSITDIILAIICFTLCARIKNNFNESYLNNAWRLFFLFTGLSTATGAICHGFELMLRPDIFNVMWMVMNIFCSISVYFALKATIRFSGADQRFNRLFHSLNFISLITFTGLTVINNDFEIFKIHAAIGLSLILIIHMIAYFKSHKGGSGSVVLGMLLSFLTVFIHTRQISISIWFDFKDISHVIMMISLILIYNGVKKMQQNPKLSMPQYNVVGN